MTDFWNRLHTTFGDSCDLFLACPQLPPSFPAAFIGARSLVYASPEEKLAWLHPPTSCTTSFGNPPK